MNAALCIVFFASGAAALLFETLWFRQAGLLLGNSIWATSLVTSSFMAGLALGNVLAARRGGRLRRPVLTYATLEGAISASGLGLVLVLPHLGGLVAPGLATLVSAPIWLNAARFGLAFVLLLVPSTAMGATLPILARALTAHEPRFGRVLGSLYGWNTLGAVAGALAGEGFLVERLGLRGTGLCAAGLDLACAGAALALARHAGDLVQADPVAPVSRAPAASRRLIAAAALAGGLLLALEVVWFRLLLLFLVGTSLAFAVMLAVVLAGIGLGGLLTGRVAPSPTGAWRALPCVALAAGGTTAWTYAALGDVLTGFQERYLSTPLEVLAMATALMLPTSFLSGSLFTLMGTALKDEGHGAAGTAGRLTFANTLGATLGPLLAAFLLLPGIGIERSLFLLAATYGGLALLTTRQADRADRRAGVALALTATGFALVLTFYPFGLMANHYVPLLMRRFVSPGIRVQARREGLTETITYLSREMWGVPVSHRLVTNGHSMSGSIFSSERYMRLFVYWPMALHPHPRRALLISYGVGLTAKSLTDAEGLESIDVVDISKDILELGRIVFPTPGSFPLDDPRVRVHVEDGRFFLQMSRGSYDLITAEPPPPKSAGIVNLYSREYFELIHERLAPGGLATYWLPVYQLEPRESKAVIRAFCDVFSDCSLWTGFAFEWMLAGGREARQAVSPETLARQWSDPRLGPGLRALGFEGPEQLGTTFLADADTLRQLTAGTPPLDDDHPLRLTSRLVNTSDPQYWDLLDAQAARARFEASAWVRARWPPSWRERSLEAFELQQLANRAYVLPFGAPPLSTAELTRLLTRSFQRAPVLTALRISEAEVRAAHHAQDRGVADPFVDEVLAIDQLASRDYGRAAAFLQAAERGSHARELRQLRVLALGLAGRTDEARAALALSAAGATPAERQVLDWLAQRFHLD